jgi:hypothetical protein
MKQLFVIVIMGVSVLVCSFSTARGVDRDVIRALEEIGEHIEQGASYEELLPMLDAVRPQIDALERGTLRKDCFRTAVKGAYYWYDLGAKSWAALMENEREKERYEIQAEYGESEMKEISLTMVENYEKLIEHARKALPSKWDYAKAALDQARQCLKLK